MGDLVRFGVSAEEELIVDFDRLSADKGYGNRSEALRDLMRDALVQSRLEKFPDTADVLGSLTLVYDHHARELLDRMGEIQHERHGLVLSVLHVHVSHDDCMEVIIAVSTSRTVLTRRPPTQLTFQYPSMFVRRMGARSPLPRDDLPRGERQEQLPMLDTFQAE